MKLSLFADDMIVYTEKPIDSTKKVLDLINEFRKTAGYKVNTELKVRSYINWNIIKRRKKQKIYNQRH